MAADYRIGVDTGGTYTDAVLCSAAGDVLRTAKALTTKHDLSIGIGDAVGAILDAAPGGGASDPVDPAQIGLVSISTTLATNAVVEAHGQPIALILIGESDKALDRAGLRQALGVDPAFTVAGGHASFGDEAAALDIDAVDRAIDAAEGKVAAFAVSGLFGVRNPAHEIAVRDRIIARSGLPVTCGHELSSGLDMPRRALTAVLNARLIPMIAELIEAVEAALAKRGVTAPVMMVKGDGSLISTKRAHTRPVETVLSGPAASVVGARHLTQRNDLLVSDIGGTTTDIAILQGGRPRLSRDGATIGGWRTMVEAVAVHTVGLGGDSEVGLDDNQRLTLGPRRAVPISLLAHQYPAALDRLKTQAARTRPKPHDGRFALQQRRLAGGSARLSASERRLWDKLEDGPLDLETLLSDRAPEQPLRRLMDRGLVALAAFTPSDAAHVLGLHDAWSTEAAHLAAQLWAGRERRSGAPFFESPDAFCQAVVDRLIARTGEAVTAALIEAETPDAEAARTAPGPMARRFLDRAFGAADGGLLQIEMRYALPLAAIGAPAAAYYPAFEARTGNQVLLPEHGAVSNAIGAVVGGVAQTVRVAITAPNDQTYRVHGPGATADFQSLEQAAAHAAELADDAARDRAHEAGAVSVEVSVERRDRVAAQAGGPDIFVESEIAATAIGRPAL
ncbi:MAG: hydantoinase/oxoprolinase family protein [Alphaproteobacteria bacterium]|nr:hydantoinase/oxoprolinase family protein [Alphaproteobacteria bacterium]